LGNNVWDELITPIDKNGLSEEINLQHVECILAIEEDSVWNKEFKEQFRDQLIILLDDEFTMKSESFEKSVQMIRDKYEILYESLKELEEEEE